KFPFTTPIVLRRVTAFDLGSSKIASPSKGASSKCRKRNPIVSNDSAKCCPPFHEPTPRDARKPHNPQRLAGNRIEPPVSVPIAHIAEPSKRLAAAPLLEPPVRDVGFAGCKQFPKSWFSPVRPHATSLT